MPEIKSKTQKRKVRHKRVRAIIVGTSERPRLSIFRSNRHLWTQLIDDASGKTILAANDLEIIKSKKMKNKRVDLAKRVGELIAEKALKKKIVQAVFDRGGYKYHGVVKAAAEGARKGGLKF